MLARVDEAPPAFPHSKEDLQGREWLGAKIQPEPQNVCCSRANLKGSSRAFTPPLHVSV